MRVRETGRGVVGGGGEGDWARGFYLAILINLPWCLGGARSAELFVGSLADAWPKGLMLAEKTPGKSSCDLWGSATDSGCSQRAKRPPLVSSAAETKSLRNCLSFSLTLYHKQIQKLKLNSVLHKSYQITLWKPLNHYGLNINQYPINSRL